MSIHAGQGFYVHWIRRLILFHGPTIRASWRKHLLADGYDVRTVQELLGHKDVRTTMIYTHLLNRAARGVRSPAERLGRLPGGSG